MVYPTARRAMRVISLLTIERSRGTQVEVGARER
jgi:hypothetical protein